MKALIAYNALIYAGLMLIALGVYLAAGLGESLIVGGCLLSALNIYAVRAYVSSPTAST